MRIFAWRRRRAPTAIGGAELLGLSPPAIYATCNWSLRGDDAQQLGMGHRMMHVTKTFQMTSAAICGSFAADDIHVLSILY
jgi:hypothetical protein